MVNRGARLIIAGAIALIVGVVTMCTASGCTRTVRVPVYVEPRPCLTRPAPRPPAAAFGSPAWSAWLSSLVRWSVAAEESCGVEPPEADPVPEVQR